MPTRQVDIGDVADVIREAEGLLNETEVAERYGISRPALSRYRDELTATPGIRHDVVGQSHVYWSEKVRGDGHPGRTSDPVEAGEEEEHTATSNPYHPAIPLLMAALVISWSLDPVAGAVTAAGLGVLNVSLVLGGLELIGLVTALVGLSLLYWGDR